MERPVPWTARAVPLMLGLALASCNGEALPSHAFARISAGYDHTCAVTLHHEAWCWGSNWFGALGDGTTTDRAEPVRVAGNLLVDSISAGYAYTCALTTVGGVWCWGLGTNGQLGDGAAQNSTVPVLVATRGFRSVSAGEAHTCGQKTSGSTVCWGAALSTDTAGNIVPPQLVPTPVPGPAFSAVSSGFEIACALTAAGEPWCWGLRAPGIHPTNPLQASSNDPLPVTSNGVVFGAISTAHKQACGLTADGAAYCWGENPVGQLGIGSQTDTTMPAAVAGGLRLAEVSARGPGHACAVTRAGVGYCWGSNQFGRLGSGDTASSTVPVPVAGGLMWGSLSAGFLHTCGITIDGAAWCWGSGDRGRLGTGDAADQSVPARVRVPPELR